MVVAYTYLKYKDVHTIQNDEPTLSIQYTVTKLDCDSTTVLGQFVLLPGITKDLKFSMQGKYQILVEAIGDPNVTPETFELLYYNELLLSFIFTVNLVLCGCNGCKTTTSCEDQLAASVKALSFLNVNYPTYNSYLNIIVEDFTCIFNDELNCALLQEKIYGEIPVTETVTQILAFHYLAFYYKDLALAADVEEKTFIATKYNFANISKCMRAKGINPTAIIETIAEAGIAYHWQLDNLTDGLAEVVNLLTLPYLQTKDSLLIEEFKTGINFTFDTVGRIVFSLKGVEPNQHVFLDFMGNDITLTVFDKAYDAISRIETFVSKEYYTPSTVYLKLLKL